MLRRADHAEAQTTVADLRVTPDPSAGGQPAVVSDTNLPSLFTALEEQLGLIRRQAFATARKRNMLM